MSFVSLCYYMFANDIKRKIHQNKQRRKQNNPFKNPPPKKTLIKFGLVGVTCVIFRSYSRLSFSRFVIVTICLQTTQTTYRKLGRGCVVRVLCRLRCLCRCCCWGCRCICYSICLQTYRVTQTNKNNYKKNETNLTTPHKH